MATRVDTTKLVRSSDIMGDDEEDTLLLRSMLDKAREYVRSFAWCPAIAAEYLGQGIGGVVAVFLFEFVEPVGGTDEQLWVVAGDLPSAYLVTDEAPDAAAALEAYCGLMEEWAETVLSGGPLAGVYPVRAKPTPEHAEMLLSRTSFIRKKILPDSG
jgi:hypothetical protein